MIDLKKYRSSSGYFTDIMIGKVASMVIRGTHIADREVEKIIQELEFMARGAPVSASADYMRYRDIADGRKMERPIIVILNIEQSMGAVLAENASALDDCDYSHIEKQLRESKDKQSTLLLLK